jgi:hypothetical protein
MHNMSQERIELAETCDGVRLRPTNIMGKGVIVVSLYNFALG